jgi:periplasmic protein TonB
MFEQTFVTGTGKTNKPWTTAFGFILQCVVIGIAVLVPMIFTDVLPAGQLKSLLVAPPPPPPPPPPPAEIPKVAVKVIPRQFDAGRLVTPKSVPTQVATIREEELPPPSAVAGGVAGGIGAGFTGGALGNLLGSVPTAAAPPPPKEEKKKEIQRIKVGGNVQLANVIKRVTPQYPAIARQARIQDHVILHAIISREGTIQDLRVVSGHPLLRQAALDAVKQWLYKPTMLNSEPVEVETEIDVNFTLQQ